MKPKILVILMAALTAVCLVTPAFSQEAPKPGTTIDKNNYKKYAAYFPDEFLPAFEDGFGGIFQPIHVNVVASRSAPQPKALLELSAKNKGKYGIDAQGFVTGGWAYDGLPFPDVQRSDKDFAAKFMWNYNTRYREDEQDETGNGGSFEKRRGEDLRWNNAQIIYEFFKNRLVCAPKPVDNNAGGLYFAFLLHFKRPDSVKNMMQLSYRYLDQKKGDDMWMYLPALRRTLRAEAGQRSTPVMGSTQSLDDFNVFDGRPMDFTYTIVKEQKVLACMDNTLKGPQAKTFKKTEIPFAYDGYSVRDTYVIDIKPKDPKYPQGRKRIWVDKESLNPLYGVAWDRAGKVWKAWVDEYEKGTMPNGDIWTQFSGFFGVDIQFGMASQYVSDIQYNKCKYQFGDFSPSALLKRAR